MGVNGNDKKNFILICFYQFLPVRIRVSQEQLFPPFPQLLLLSVSARHPRFTKDAGWRRRCAWLAFLIRYGAVPDWKTDGVKRMADVTCSRCGQTREGFERPPFPGAVGARILGEICKDCWGLWLKQQTMLINHYGLNVMDPQARTFLTRNMDAFLFKKGDAEDVDTTKQGSITW